MKHLGLFIFLFVCSILTVQGQTSDYILFDYDGAGNQVKRYLIEISGNRHANPKAISALTDEDLKKSDLYDDVKYYPNPVKNELYVLWEKNGENYVERVELYSLNGQLLSVQNNLKELNSTTILFGNYPQGIYTVVLVYTNEHQKTLKVVKH